MQKLVLTLLFGSVLIGALMPSAPPDPAAPSDLPPPRDPAPTPASAAKPQVETQAEVGSGSMTIERSGDGHFYAEVQVNGMPIQFLVDTGASGIALSREDAQTAFVPTDPTQDETIGSGASGPVKGQFVRLDRVKLGPVEVQDAPAAVLAGGKQSLLGQSFLAQFKAVTIQGDTMVLR